MTTAKQEPTDYELKDRLPETEDEVRAHDLFAHVVDVVREGGDDALAWKPIARALQEARDEQVASVRAELAKDDMVNSVARVLHESREADTFDQAVAALAAIAEAVGKAMGPG